MTVLKSIDISTLEFFNQFAQKSWVFDRVMCAFEGEPLAKGGVLTAFLWWAWFRAAKDKLHERKIVIAGVIAAIAALAVARVAAFCLPYRQRPIFTDALHFRLPFGTDSASLINWSSFPSDHAALYFALATVVFLVSRRAGILAYIYTAVFICFPRLYVGDHYPTDLIAGALLGIVITCLFATERVRESISRFPLQKLETAPAGFYVTVYLGSYLLANNFDQVRKVGSLLFHSLRTHGGI